MKVNAYAKINLTLDIIGLREDGFHDIDTVMQTVDLCDEIDLSKNKTEQINLTCSKILLPTDDRNLAYRAAKRIMEHCGISDMGVNIHVVKNIPVKAGLGGGSADAAAVILGLNELFSLGLSVEEMSEIGADIGADVPFCIQRGTKRCQGKGEIMSELVAMPDCQILICKPPVSVSTKEAYDVCDKYPQEGLFLTENMIDALASGDIAEVAINISNRFDEILHISEVEVIKSIMLGANALNASMTGSGSAVFGIYDNNVDLSAVKESLKSLGECFITKPIQN